MPVRLVGVATACPQLLLLLLLRVCCRSDESNATTGKRLESVGVENSEDNRRAWRELLYTAPGLGQYISGCIMFEETLYQKAADGRQFVDILKGQGILPGIKVDTGLQVREEQGARGGYGCEGMCGGVVVLCAGMRGVWAGS